MHHKFSVGDKVVVVGCELGGNSFAYNFHAMPEYNESVTEITHVFEGANNCPYMIKADNGRFVWSEDWLIPYCESQCLNMDIASNEEILSMLNQEVLS